MPTAIERVDQHPAAAPAGADQDGADDQSQGHQQQHGDDERDEGGDDGGEQAEGEHLVRGGRAWRAYGARPVARASRRQQERRRGPDHQPAPAAGGDGVVRHRDRRVDDEPDGPGPVRRQGLRQPPGPDEAGEEHADDEQHAQQTHLGEGRHPADAEEHRDRSAPGRLTQDPTERHELAHWVNSSRGESGRAGRSPKAGTALAISRRDPMSTTTITATHTPTAVLTRSAAATRAGRGWRPRPSGSRRPRRRGRRWRRARPSLAPAACAARGPRPGAEPARDAAAADVPGRWTRFHAQAPTTSDARRKPPVSTPYTASPTAMHDRLGQHPEEVGGRCSR